MWSTMVVYPLAFIMSPLALARRSAAVQAPGRVTTADGAVTAGAVPTATAAGSAGARGAARSGQNGSVGTLDRPDTAPAAPRYRFERIAFALTIIGWVIHVAAVVMRGVAQGHVPWSNMFEFSLTASAIIVGVFIFVQLWQNLRFLGAFITGFGLIALGVGTVNFYVDVKPLPPALQSAWLVIHVFVAVLGTSFFALGAGLSVMQLLQAKRAAAKGAGLKFLQTLPSSEVLENLAYRVVVVGFVFWTFTLIAGAVWAERAWGRYWGWDTKEVWTFIIWTIFAGYIHARATRGWRGSRSAWLAIIGFSAVVFNFTIVNLYFEGLHSYSGL
nr:c-type cytochrome biogenesis protein CcsB [Marisediminicola senii]